MTQLKLQKRLAAQAAGVGKSRIIIDSSHIKDTKEAITKADVRALIKQGVITIKRTKVPSRHRARARHERRMKGRQRGPGTRRGSTKARTGDTWTDRIRAQRKLLRDLKLGKQLETKVYRNLYRKAKGGFFRSRKHMLTYIEQNVLLVKR